MGFNWTRWHEADWIPGWLLLMVVIFTFVWLISELEPVLRWSVSTLH